jgi:AraC-like DNA-binding protein
MCERRIAAAPAATGEAMRVLYSTDAVPAHDRFDYFRDVAASTPVPLEIRGERGSRCNVRMEILELGASTLSTMTARDDTRLELYRTPRLIRRSDPGAYRLLLNVQGRIELVQEGRQAHLTAGQMALYDISRPFHGWRQATRGSCQLVMLTVPHSLLPPPSRSIRQLIGAKLASRTGVGALVVDHLTRMATDADSYTPADRGRLARVSLDLLDALVAHELDTAATAAADPESSRRVLLLRVHAFIDQRLSDSALSPEAVAAAHHVSLRSLQKLFQAEGITVAAWIRRRRLARCRDDLADASLWAQPIHRIGARWGFSDPGQFSRVFRDRYGMCPREWRELAARAAPAAAGDPAVIGAGAPG